MWGADSLSEFDEDEFLTGGPCPSCRLAIDKETGRLKWCTARNEAWRFRVKLMLLIPAVLLAITIIFIALSRSQVINKASYQRAYLDHDNGVHDKKSEQTNDELFTPTSYSIGEGADEIENGKMETSCLPVKSSNLRREAMRRKREIDQVSLPGCDPSSDDCFTMHDSSEEKKDSIDESSENTEYEDSLEESDKRDQRKIREAQARIMLKHMDKTTDPCDDFYQYACGNWEKSNPIPDDKAGYDIFEIIRESLSVVLRELLEDPIPPGTNYITNDALIKAKNLYRSCMDNEILELLKEQPLIEILDELGGWPVLKRKWDSENFDWLLLIAKLRKYNNDVLIREQVEVDIKNSSQYIIQFDQASLGLPVRDYFLSALKGDDLNAYKTFLINVVTLLGARRRRAISNADELIEFETKLAKISVSPDQRRNFTEVYQRMTLGELMSRVPQINWQRYLTIVLGKPVDISESVVILSMHYMQDLVNLLSTTPSRTIANYVLWRFVLRRINNLDGRFHAAKQTFYHALFGRMIEPAGWKNCVEQVNSNMGMAVGSMFVKKYFDEESKEDTLEITRNIQRVFKERLQNVDWIVNNTKELAIEKLDSMLLTIGYPDFILKPDLLNERYKDVTIYPDRYFENTLNILQHLTKSEHSRLGKLVEKNALWLTAPATVNAYYGRTKNRMMFPAGILQPPFYHRHFPVSLNYGGIGTVIGHEITHGFDDEGRYFDKEGNMHQWWTLRETFIFHWLALCLKNQYDLYFVPELFMFVNGSNTQGENIADNGGVKHAFQAYVRWSGQHKDVDETLPGMNATGEQLFFLNYAQLWCSSMRPGAMAHKLVTGVHSPARYRVIGTLSNSVDFARVFNCPRGAPMNPEKKCSVW